MQIFSTSLASAADTFLHAGYISAQPRTLGSYSLPAEPPRLQLDAAEAVQLDGAAPAMLEAPVTGAAGGLGSWLSDLTMLAAEPAWVAAGAMLFVVALLAGGLIGEWRGRRRLQPSATVLRTMATTGMLAVVGWLAVAGAQVTFAGVPQPTESPIELRPYLHPEQATQVILHGLVGEALAASGRGVKYLPDIRGEVGLPTGELTPGQAQAVAAYDHDGWGRPLRYQAGLSAVASAGQDGKFDTSDDLEIQVNPWSNESFDGAHDAYWVQRADGQTRVFFHRWTGSKFRYLRGDEAMAITGGQLFDFLGTEDLEHSTHLHELWLGTRDEPAHAADLPLTLWVF